MSHAIRSKDGSRITNPLEYEEQHAFTQELELHKIPFLVSSSGGKRSKATASLMKYSGLRPGQPDIFIPIASAFGDYVTNGLFIELKRLKGGSVTKTQRTMHSILTLEGYDVVVVKGAVAAMQYTWSYLNKAGRVHQGRFIQGKDIC